MEKITCQGQVLGSGPDCHPHARREYRCRFVRAGRTRASGNQSGGLLIPAPALQAACAAGLFTGRAVFLDHSSAGEYPSLHNLAGVTAAPQWNEQEQAVDGLIRLYATPLGEAVANLLDMLLAEGEGQPDIGLSIVFWPEWEPGSGGELRQVAGIRHVESVDLVFEPAAGGRILQALSAGTPPTGDSAGPAHNIPVLVALPFQPQSTTHLDGGPVSGPIQQGGASMPEPTHPQNPSPTGAAGAPDLAAQDFQPDLPVNDPGEASGRWLQAIEQAGVSALLAGSGLPPAAQARLQAQHYPTPAALTAAIEAERSYLAGLLSGSTVQLGGPAPRSPQISLGRTGVEQVQLALEALIAGSRPPQGVAPLTGIREAYVHLSGDYEMTGLFHPERVSLANVTSATMAGLVANALNKRVVSLFQEYPHWWERICTIEDFTNLQQVKWITLGGVGELPTVAEGAAYSELTWGDKTESADFIKKGGYLGLTIEAIDKDDTRKLQAAPRALAQAAWLTLGRAVAAIFTAGGGVGPAMSDGKALFHLDHGNLAASTLAWASYVAARSAMRRQTELSSGERLGALAAPHFLLVPPDLEISALQILASEQTPGGGDNDTNPLAEGDFHDARMRAARDRVVVVDLWSDAGDWALAADPRLYPTIGLGFRYGRAPEIFSVASPTAGLMFTNDVMPVKVRFIFAVGPMDWRGLYKSNAA